MHSHISRSEHLEVELYESAEKGSLSENMIKKIDSFSKERIILYLGEIARLQRRGFTVIIDGIFDSQKKLYYVTIDWSNPFNGKVPHMVYSYINGIIDTFPQDYIKNFAQKLYVIAQRANRK